MTEYDYSPEAMERHLATQQRIARWVDNTLEHSPANPFIPLPGEHAATQPQTPQSQPQPQPYPHPHPAFYTTPQGVISPTYSSSHRTGSNQMHNPNPQPVMPLGYRPVMDRSFSTPPLPGRKFYSSPLAPHRPPTPYPTGSPAPSNSPYGYCPPYQPSPTSHPSYSQTSFHSAASNPNPIIHQQRAGNTYPYFQPSPPQPVVVVKGERSCVVVPPPGQHVQIINTDQTSGGLFGKIKIRSSKSKKSKRSRDR